MACCHYAVHVADNTYSCVETIGARFSASFPGPVSVVKGVDLNSTDDSDVAAALAAAQAADMVVLTLGLGNEQVALVSDSNSVLVLLLGRM